MPRIGVSFSIAVSDFVRPNSSAAFAACGFVSFIWPRMAPTISTSEEPPILSQMCFQDHALSRLMSRSFSVRSDRFMGASLYSVMPGLVPGIHVFLVQDVDGRDKPGHDA